MGLPSQHLDSSVFVQQQMYANEVPKRRKGHGGQDRQSFGIASRAASLHVRNFRQSLLKTPIIVEVGLLQSLGATGGRQSTSSAM